MTREEKLKQYDEESKAFWARPVPPRPTKVRFLKDGIHRVGGLTHGHMAGEIAQIGRDITNNYAMFLANRGEAEIV